MKVDQCISNHKFKVFKSASRSSVEVPLLLLSNVRNQLTTSAQKRMNDRCELPSE